MLEINKHHIPEGGMTVEATLPASSLALSVSSRISEISPTVCDLKISILNDDLIVRGDAGLTIRCQCDRCLSDTEVDIFVDDICIVVENCPDKVDLTNNIREDILLAFPQTYLCNRDCKGLCFQCGTDLNSKQCQCGELATNNSPWNALDKINFENNK